MGLGGERILVESTVIFETNPEGDTLYVCLILFLRNESVSSGLTPGDVITQELIPGGRIIA